MELYAVVPPRPWGCIGVILLPGGTRRSVALPMASLHVQATLQGRMASVVVRQRFDNAMAGAQTVPEVSYVWPTDEGAVLYALAATTPEGTIHAALKEAAVAKAEYQAAKEAGQFAAHAHAVTTRETEVALGNIQAGWTVEVEVRYAVILPIKAGNERVAEWWLPTFLTPRFGVDTVTGRQAIDAKTAIDVHVRVVHSDGCVVTATNGDAAFAVRNGDTYLSFDKAGDFKSELRVRVAFPNDLPDRLLAAPVPAAAGRPAGHALLYTGQLRFAHDDFFLDVAVVIDRSGSMYDSMGDPDNRSRKRIEAVADGLKVLASCLRKGDRISVSEFGSAGNDVHSLPLSAWDNDTKATMLARSEAMTKSDLGGTEPYTCLEAAVRGLHTGPDAAGRRQRTVLFFGDGDLGGRTNDLVSTMADAYTQHHIYTSVIAIGSGCNTDLLKRMAMQGRGMFEHVLSGKDMLQTISGMAVAARELPVHRVEFAPVTPSGTSKGAAAAGPAPPPTAVGVWTQKALDGTLAPPDATAASVARTTATVPTSLKSNASTAVPVPLPPQPANARAPPSALYAMAPSALRASTAVTLALLVPERPTAVRITATFLVADPATGADMERSVSLDLDVDPALAADDVTVEPAVVALAGTTLLTEALRVFDAQSRLMSASDVERGLTALAVQTVTSCRLTSWIAVDPHQRRLIERQGSEPVHREPDPVRRVLGQARPLGSATVPSRRYTASASAGATSSARRTQAALDSNLMERDMQAPLYAMASGSVLGAPAIGVHRSRSRDRDRSPSPNSSGSLFDSLVSVMTRGSAGGSKPKQASATSAPKTRARASGAAYRDAAMPVVSSMSAQSAPTVAAYKEYGFPQNDYSIAELDDTFSGYIDDAAMAEVDDWLNTKSGEPPSGPAAPGRPNTSSRSASDIVGLLSVLQDVDGGWRDLPSDLAQQLAAEVAKAGKILAALSDPAHAATELVIAWLEVQLAVATLSEYIKQQIQPMLVLARSFIA